MGEPRFTIEPVEGERSEHGWQYGYMLKIDGRDFLHLTTGGTGDCWNLESAPEYVGEEPGEQERMHVCDLDEFIAALQALRDSEPHRRNVERWAPQPTGSNTSPSASGSPDQ